MVENIFLVFSILFDIISFTVRITFPVIFFLVAMFAASLALGELMKYYK